MSCHKVESLPGDGCFTVKTISGTGCFTVVDNNNVLTPIDTPDNPIDPKIPVPEHIYIHDHPEWNIHEVWKGDGGTLFLWVSHFIDFQDQHTKLVKATYEEGFDSGIVGKLVIFNEVTAEELGFAPYAIPDSMYGGLNDDSPLALSYDGTLVSKTSLTVIRSLGYLGDSAIKFWADDQLCRGVYVENQEEYNYPITVTVYDKYRVESDDKLGAHTGTTVTTLTDNSVYGNVPRLESYDGLSTKEPHYTDCGFVAKELQFETDLWPRSIFNGDQVSPDLTIPMDLSEIGRMDNSSGGAVATLSAVPDPEYYRIALETDSFYILREQKDHTPYIFIKKSDHDIRQDEITFVGKFSALFTKQGSVGQIPAEIKISVIGSSYAYNYDFTEIGVPFGDCGSLAYNRSGYFEHSKIQFEDNILTWRDGDFNWINVKTKKTGSAGPHSTMVNGAILTADGGHFLKQKEI